VGSGPSNNPAGTNSHPLPSPRMMKASVPDRASSAMPSGLGFASGALVAAKSGTS